MATTSGRVSTPRLSLRDFEEVRGASEPASPAGGGGGDPGSSSVPAPTPATPTPSPVRSTTYPDLRGSARRDEEASKKEEEKKDNSSFEWDEDALVPQIF